MSPSASLNNQPFKVFNTIKQAWGFAKHCKWPILAPWLVPVGLLFLMGIILGIFDATRHIENEKMHFIASVLTLGTLFICTPFFIGAWMTAIKRVKGETVNAGTAFKYCRQWLPILGYVIIVWLILAIVVICLILIMTLIIKLLPAHPSHLVVLYAIVPAVILLTLVLYVAMSLIMFTIPLKLDLGLSLWQALSRSVKIVKPHWPTLLGLLIIINLLSMIFYLFLHIPFVGWIIYILIHIWFIPIAVFCFAVAYHQLLSRDQHHAQSFLPSD